MNDGRSALLDILVTSAFIALAIVTYFGIVMTEWPVWVPLLGLTCIVAFGLTLLVARFTSRPDHIRALQSHKILSVANEAISYLREGLTEGSAQAACRIILAEANAAAVAITDTTHILGFAGLGEDHHEVGRPIMTRSTKEVIETGELRILSSKQEIGCPRPDCSLVAAVVVPLMMRDVPVGSLKFYYSNPLRLSETQIAMAEGLAHVLSTQLELSELERQTELATRMELKALQAQINPHFLFNTINTIASLIRTEPTRARELLRDFASFYRRTLESSEDLISLQTELDQTHRYLAFEQARFGDRIRVEEKIRPEDRELMVPAFIVQPIVENSVAHGMRPDEPLVIGVSSAASGSDGVCIIVTDTGVGIPPDRLGHVLEPGFGDGLGIALKNVDDRLKGHFGPGSGVKVESKVGIGTTVSLTLAHVGHTAGGNDA